MARSRRPRGPDLRGTLGTLVRSTLAQAGVFRDVLERGAREGRARLDDVRRDRKRTDALAHLGEAVMEALRAGELAELFDHPAIAEAIADVEVLDDEPSPAQAWAPTARGPRYDHDDRDRDRDRHEEPAARRERAPVDRPRDRSDEPGARFRERGGDDDGTVSSAGWSPPPRPAPAAARVWRPVDPAPAPPPAAPAAAPRAGGIQFGGEDDEDDEDLAAYMNPDDVPPKKG